MSEHFFKSTLLGFLPNLSRKTSYYYFFFSGKSSPRERNRRAEEQNSPGVGSDAKRRVIQQSDVPEQHLQSTLGRESSFEPRPQRNGLHTQKFPCCFDWSLVLSSFPLPWVVLNPPVCLFVAFSPSHSPVSNCVLF